MIPNTGAGGLPAAGGQTGAAGQLGGVFGQRASPYLGAVLRGITSGANFQQAPQTPNYLSGGFNPQGYLSRYPDVAAAVQSGQVPSAMYHYMNWGMNEGRAPNAIATGGGPNYLGSALQGKFNPQSYMNSNPDVAAAVASGAVPSAYAHFMPFGLREGRSPSGFGRNTAMPPQYTVPRQSPPGMTPSSSVMPGMQYAQPDQMTWLPKPMTSQAALPGDAGAAGALTSGATGQVYGSPDQQAFIDKWFPNWSNDYVAGSG